MMVRNSRPSPRGGEGVYFQKNWVGVCGTLLESRLKNHTLWHRTYLYSLYKGVPPGSGMWKAPDTRTSMTQYFQDSAFP